MSNTFKKLILVPVLILMASFTYQAKAQQNIQEIKVVANDNFSELKQLVKDHFDFTKIDSEGGLIKTEVVFNIAKDGKIINVKASGDCPQVSAEIQDVMSNLLYKLNTKNVSDQVFATHYTMPVDVLINNR